MGVLKPFSGYCVPVDTTRPCGLPGHPLTLHLLPPWSLGVSLLLHFDPSAGSSRSHPPGETQDRFPLHSSSSHKTDAPFFASLPTNLVVETAFPPQTPLCPGMLPGRAHPAGHPALLASFLPGPRRLWEPWQMPGRLTLGLRFLSH